MAAAAAGINQWQLIFDPGLGFAKVYQESIELLRRCKEITTLGYAVVVLWYEWLNFIPQLSCVSGTFKKRVCRTLRSREQSVWRSTYMGHYGVLWRCCWRWGVYSSSP